MMVDSFFTGFIFHRMKNGEYNAINIIRNFVVPKSDHFITERVQVLRSSFIILFKFQMLTSIQFDDEFLFEADKVRDVIANGVSPAPTAGAVCLLKLTPS